MQHPIVLFALLDYIKVVIKHQDYKELGTEPFETIFISYSEEPIISSVSRDLVNKNFIEALNQINSYEQANTHFYKIFTAIKKDYKNLQKDSSEKEVTNLLQDKFGIMETDEIEVLLDMQSSFIREHEFT